MKKAVLFCPSRVWGGIEKNVHLRAKFLGESGIAVSVVLLKGCFAQRFADLENVTVIEVTSRGGDFNVFVIASYVKILRAIGPDVVFAALKKDWWLVSLAARIAGVPRVVLYLGIARRVKSPLKYYAIFRLMKSILMVNSDSLKGEMLSYPKFFDNDNVVRIYNGFNLPPASVEPLDFRTLLNLPPDTFIVGCAGRFSPQKGFDLLPDILAGLPENVHIVHAGEGEFEHQIKAAINERPESERIHFLGYQSAMAPFFKGIDTFLLCSRNEGMANVLNEAMSHGKPVVSTRVPGSEELLAYGKHGVLTDVDDTHSLSRAVLSIISGERVYSANMQRQWIDREFSMERMVTETKSLFFGPQQSE